VLRVKNFFADMNERLEQVPFVAGERISAADITTLVTVDFAKALDLSVPADHAALNRWYESVSAVPVPPPDVEARNISGLDDGLGSPPPSVRCTRSTQPTDWRVAEVCRHDVPANRRRRPVTLPVLLYHLRVDAEVLTGQWRRWLAVAVLAGPLFAVLIFTAFQFAPPSHGAVFPFAAMSVAGTILAAIFLADPLTKRKMLGIGIVIVGLLTLSGVSRCLSLRKSEHRRCAVHRGRLPMGGLRRGHCASFVSIPSWRRWLPEFFGLAVYLPFYLATEESTGSRMPMALSSPSRSGCKAYWPVRVPSIPMRKRCKSSAPPGPPFSGIDTGHCWR